jgi:hypothetical protein
MPKSGESLAQLEAKNTTTIPARTVKMVDLFIASPLEN